MRGHGRRVRGLPLLALLAIVFTSLPLVPALAQKACGAPHAKKSGEWTVLDSPAFSAGGRELTAAGVAFGGARTTLTNGAVVATTSDLECAWTEIWPAGHTNPLTDAVAPRPGETVATVVASQARSATNTIWVLLQSAGAGAVNFRVLSTRDAGQTWRVSQTPMVAAAGAASGGRCGFPNTCRMLSPASNANRLYLSFATPEGATALYVSDDAGVTFANRTNGSLLAGITGGFADLEVHPTNGDTLIGTARNDQVLVTNDGGQTFGTLNQNPAAPIGAFAIGDKRGFPDWLYGLTLDNGMGDPSIGRLWGSEDGGQIFSEGFAANIGLAGPLNSAAFAENREIYIVTQATGAALIRSSDGSRFFPITAPGRIPLREVQQVRGLGLSFVSPGAVVTYAPARAPDPPPPPPLDVDTFFPKVEPKSPPATLSPPTIQMDIPLGESRTVEFGLDLPSRKTPMDVFFLVDTSTSQEAAIDGLKSGLAHIARELSAAGLDVQFGLGEYQDSGVGQGSGIRYRRRVDIQRPSITLLRELDAMRTRGGAEPHLTALHQVATGAGVPNPSVGQAVPAGQQANWRPGSVRVVVMDTDNEYPDGKEQGFGPDPDGPSFDRTVAALNAKDIHFVGIELRKPEDGQNSGLGGGLLGLPDLTNPDIKTMRRKLMDEMARRTDSVAPLGGVDCDGDGNRELDTGEPLVCAVPFKSGTKLVDLADPIVRLLSSFADQRPAELVAVETSGLPTQTVARADYSAVDVRFDNTLFFAATFTCIDRVAGTNHPVRFDANVGVETVASTAGNVQCGKPGDPPPPRLRPQAPPPVQVAQPPPAPVTVTAVTPVTAPAAASAPAVASVGSPVGVVTEEDSPQFQVSTAGSGKGQGMMLASVVRPRREPVPAVTWIGAAGLSMAFGGVAAQRERRRRAEVRVRR